MNNKESEPINHYRLIGWCLLGLSIAANVAMAHHPYITPSYPPTQIEQMANIAPLTAYVHGLLILVVLAYIWLFALYGAAKNTSVVWLGSGLFAVGGLAMTGAALISGFLAPAMLLSSEINTDKQLAIFEFQSRLLWQSNQVLANASTFAWSCALIFWSSNLVRDKTSWRWIGSAGLLIGSSSLICMITGKWHLDVRGMSIYVLAITTWFCAFACCLLWETRKRTA